MLGAEKGLPESKKSAAKAIREKMSIKENTGKITRLPGNPTKEDYLKYVNDFLTRYIEFVKSVTPARLQIIESSMQAIGCEDVGEGGAGTGSGGGDSDDDDEDDEDDGGSSSGRGGRGGSGSGGGSSDGGDGEEEDDD